jgi:hypothetical protein
MNLLPVFIVIAALLGFALMWFLRVKEETISTSGPEGCGRNRREQRLDAEDERRFGEAIFSERDWDFVRKEGSPALEKLFVQERRTLVRHWVADSAARIRAVRKKHMESSRYSKDLKVFDELKLLLLFFYLEALCRCLRLMVQYAHPTTPRRLAVHFQNMASKLVPAGDEQLAGVAGEQFPPIPS